MTTMKASVTNPYSVKPFGTPTLRRDSLGLDQIVTSVEFINADKARKYLEAQAPNRKPRNTQFSNIKRDILAQHWKPTHQGIAFNVLGQMIDGQHRMIALIEADKEKPGVDIPVLVFRNVPDSSVANVDGNISRTIGDRERISGGRDFGTRLISTMRAFVAMPSASKAPSRITHAEFCDLYDTFGSTIEWAIAVSSETSTAPYRAALARAWYFVDRDLLERFAEVVRNNQPIDGMTSEEFSAPLALVRSFAGTVQRQGLMATIERYQKTQTAILAVQDRRIAKEIKRMYKDLWPLEEIKKMVATR